MEDFKERFLSQFKNIFERIQTSSFYVRARDQFDNMNPTQQIASLLVVVALIVFGLVYTPVTTYFSSSSNLVEFEAQRQTLRTLHQVYRESLNQPQIPTPPNSFDVKSQIEAKAKEMNFLPEQIKGIEPLEASSVSSQLIPLARRSGGVLVRFAKLNLKQIVNMGEKIQAISPSLKLQDMLMVSNQEDARYYDVNFMLVSLNVPVDIPLPPPPPPSKSKKKTKAASEDSEE